VSVLYASARIEGFSPQVDARQSALAVYALKSPSYQTVTSSASPLHSSPIQDSSYA
jgi:hypothetical protein